MLTLAPNPGLAQAPPRPPDPLPAPAALQACGCTRAPGYGPLNRSLRANSERFPATQWVIDTAVGKLAALQPAQHLFRLGIF